MCSPHRLIHWTNFEQKQNAIKWFTGQKWQKNGILSILAIFYYFHTKSCYMFEGLTHHLVGPQKWSSYWQKLETICKKLTVIVHRAKRAQFCVKSLLVKMRFQNLCFGTKIKIFNFFSFLTRNESQMVKNHLVKIQWTIWTHFWPNLSIVQIFQIFYWWNSKNYFHHNLLFYENL